MGAAKRFIRRLAAGHAQSVLISLIAFVMLQYGWTLRHPFFFDDSHTIVANSAIQSPGNLLRLWTASSYHSASPENWGYRPFTVFMHSLSWLVGGGATWPFHLVKKLTFALVCFLIFLIWRTLWRYPGYFPNNPPRIRFKAGKLDFTWLVTPDSAALVAAFVFAIHPANNQVVNYISASSSLFAGFWYLFAYSLYLAFRQERRLNYLALSCAAYAVSVLSKEEGITLPAVILLSELLLPSWELGTAPVGDFVHASTIFSSQGKTAPISPK